MSLNKKQLVNHIKLLLKPDEGAEQEDREQPNNFVLFMRDGWFFGLQGEEADHYQAALESLLRYDELAAKYSQKAIRDGFQTLVTQLASTGQFPPCEAEIKTALDSWLEEMLQAEKQEFTYYVVVENLKSTQAVQLGQVLLEPLDESRYDKLKRWFVDYMQHRLAENEEYKPEVEARMEKRHLAPFCPRDNCSLASTVMVTPDTPKGAELAMERFEEALHVLRFLGCFPYSHRLRAHIGLRGEVLSDFSSWLALSEEYLFGSSISPTGYLFSFDLTGDTIREFRQRGWDTFSRILSTPVKGPGKRAELENRLIHAITWVSKATADTSDSDSFLKFCISLESILCARGELPLGRTLGERVALLLGRDRTQRLQIFKTVKDVIYDIRSDIVHEGRAKPNNETKLVEYWPTARHYALHVIDRVRELADQHEWTQFCELRDHIDDLVFS